MRQKTVLVAFLLLCGTSLADWPADSPWRNVPYMTALSAAKKPAPAPTIAKQAPAPAVKKAEQGGQWEWVEIGRDRWGRVYYEQRWVERGQEAAPVQCIGGT